MSLLLRHLEANGPLSRADLEAATRRQQQAGGSLDTAILELGLLTPLALDALLQGACGLPGAPVRLLERGPTRPWEHVPRDLVDIGWAMPLAVEDGRLIVAVHPDLPDAKLGQLYRVVRGFYPVVAPECCLAKIAAERVGSILAPRYALILLDYLEALRSAAPTANLTPVPADREPAPAVDVPVPADRQMAGPRPAAPASSGPATSRASDAGGAVPAGSSRAVTLPATADAAPAPEDFSAAPPSQAPADASGPVPEDISSAGSQAPAGAPGSVPGDTSAPPASHASPDTTEPVPEDISAPPASHSSPDTTGPVPEDTSAPPASHASPDTAEPVSEDISAPPASPSSPDTTRPVPASAPRDSSSVASPPAPAHRTGDSSQPVLEDRSHTAEAPVSADSAAPGLPHDPGDRSFATASHVSEDRADTPAAPGAADAAEPEDSAPGLSFAAETASPEARESSGVRAPDLAGDAEASGARNSAAAPVPFAAVDTQPADGEARALSSEDESTTPAPGAFAGPPDARATSASAAVSPVSSDISSEAGPAAAPGDASAPPAAGRTPEPDSPRGPTSPVSSDSRATAPLPSAFDGVPVAPDAPLVTTAAFDGAQASALAIAPDTPLIILPTAGHRAPTAPLPLALDRRPSPPPTHGPDGAPRPHDPADATPDRPSPRTDTQPAPSASQTTASAQPALSASQAPAPAEEQPPPASSQPVPSASHPPASAQPDPSASQALAPAEAQPPPASSQPVPSASHPPAAQPDPSDSQPPASTQPDSSASPQPDDQPAAAPQPMVMTLAQRLDAARTALATARERDRITEALVRAATLIAPRVALFGVKREGLRVLAAPGSALALAEGLVVPLPEGGLLDRAVSGQGPLHLLIEPSLSTAVGQPLGIPCVFEPVLAGGRTVLMLYIDRAGVAFDPRERTVIRELCDTARQSLEALLRLLGWVVPGGQPGAGPVDRSRPTRPHLASPVVTVDDTEGPATDPPEPADREPTAPVAASPDPAPAPRAPAPERAQPELSHILQAAELGSIDSASASRSRGRGTRGRGAIITLKNPIRRDEPPQVIPLPARPESSGASRAEPLRADGDEPAREGSDGRAPDEAGSNPGGGLGRVPVPLGSDSGDSPLVARFAALAAIHEQRDADRRRRLDEPVAEDMPDRPGPEGQAPFAMSDVPRRPAAEVDMPSWIATPEPSGIEDPLPVASALLSAGLAAVDDPAAAADPDPASTLPGARIVAPEAPPREPWPEEPPRAASDTPTVLDLSPPPSHEPPPPIESRSSPDTPTVLDIAPLDDGVPPTTLIPHLIAPPGAAGAPRKRRPEPVEAEPVLVIPKTLRRSGGLTATPHPMARRSDPGEAEDAPTLSMPSTLIGPRSGRRRGKHEPRPEAPTDALTMPRLVRPADEPPPEEPDGAPAAADEAGAPEHVSEDMPDTTGPQEPAHSDMPQAPGAAADDLAGAEPAGGEAAPAAALSDEEVDAVIEAFLRDPAERSRVARLRALDERGLARLAARFPGPIDLANATNFPPPSAHGPLLRACVELGPAVTPHVLAQFASARPQIRFYAAFLFQELRDPRCLRPLGELAFDADPDVRLIATRVLESYSRVPDFAAVAAAIRDELDSRDHDRQLLAVEAAGTLRDTLAVPRLIDLLAIRDKHVREAALEALCSITAKHHGYRAARWRAWYDEHGQEPRIEWVIDGLRHRDVAVRRWAADELARISGQRIPFPAEGDRRSRDLALRAWQAWWDSNREDFTAGA